MLKKISKNVKTLGLVSFLNDASSDMIYPLIPIFVTKTLGATFTVVGIIEGIAESTASLLKVFSGWLSDKLGKRKGLVGLGYGLSMIAKPLLAFAQAPWHVLVVRFFDRFGKGMRQAPRDAMIAESSDAKVLGYSYGFHKAMDTFGATLGPVLAMLLLPLLDNNFRSLFFLSFIASLLALLTLLFFVKEPPAVSDIHLHKISFKKIPRLYKVFLLAIAIFTVGNSSEAFLFLRAQSVGVAIALLPVLYAVSNIIFAVLALPFGKLADKIGAQRIIVWGYGIFALAYFGFAVADSPAFMWILFPAVGVFSAMTESLQKTITVQFADPTLKGTMLGLMHTTVGVFKLPASIIAGALWEKIGIASPFLFSASTAVAAMIILSVVFVIHRKSNC